MIQVNDNFIKLPGNYLFSSIAKKVNAFKSAHPEAALIRLGIGDVTRPLPPASIKAMHRAVDELADAGTFHGYGPEQGYDFLIQAILEHDYRLRGVELRPTEIFVSDGAKSDTGNFGDILGTGNKVAVTDPVYPVYIDSNVMAGRAGELQANGQWNRLTYLPCTAENHFIPSLPQESVDMIYLCYPNNPTGTTLTKAELQKWVDYTLAHKALILYDAAYEAYICESDVPHSIYCSCTYMYEYFGGVTRILVPDNTMTAVIYNNDWYNQELNTIYHEMAEHYNTAIIPARVRAPKDKPNAEGSVGVISTWITAALRNEQFFSLAELNQAIRRKLKEFVNRPFQKKEGTRYEIFRDKELPLLAKLPATPYELAEWKQATV